MIHLLKYNVLRILREKMNVFWALVFPIVLATLFYFSFGKSGEEYEMMEEIPAAVVMEESDPGFEAYLEALDEKMLRIEEMTKAEAKERLWEGDIQGIFYTGNERRLEVSASSIFETILKTLLDTYEKNEAMISDIAEKHPERVGKAVESLEQYETMIEEVSAGGKTMDTNVQNFFALIAMACLYGCFLGFETAVELQANQSPIGARRSVVAVNRFKLVVSDLLAVFLIHYCNVLILIGYLHYVLKIRLMDNVGGMLLVCLMGSLIGVCIGILTANIRKCSFEVKGWFLIAFSLSSSFCAGLMITGVKDGIERNFPALNRINPASLIADAFYCMTVYDDAKRYRINLVTLGIMSVILIIVSFLEIRRVRYDSV